MKIGYLMQEGVPDVRKEPLSGAANHVVYVIQELKRVGHQVVLLARLGGKMYISEDLKDFIPVEVHFFDHGIIRLVERVIRRIQHVLKFPYANLFESLRFAFACRQILSDCDIFYERMGWLGYGGGVASKWLNIPLVLEVNGDALDEFVIQGLKVKKIQQHLSFFLMKRAARCTIHVVATGDGWRQKYIERWKIATTKVSVIENGSVVVDILKRDDIKAFAPHPSGEQVHICYCGGFEPWHGIPILVAAVKKAVLKGCNIHVTLIGAGPQQQYVENLIQELGLEPRFSFTGHLNIRDTARCLAMTEIGVSPYCGRVEFSGLKLLDYKAAGLATIASGVGKQPEVIVHGRTGLIVPPCDEDALGDAIVELARNPRLRREMGQRARMEAEKFHRWRNTADELEKLFKSMLLASDQGNY